jgi:hypothetical protein
MLSGSKSNRSFQARVLKGMKSFLQRAQGVKSFKVWDGNA